MSKTTAVLFEKGKYPRIFKNPGNLNELQKYGTVLINPAIPKGVAPHEWYLSGGVIKSKIKSNGYSKPAAVHVKKFPWFKGLVVGSILVLFCLEAHSNREEIGKVYKLIKSTFVKIMLNSDIW